MPLCNHQTVYLICHLIVYLTHASLESPAVDNGGLSKLYFDSSNRNGFNQTASFSETYETDREEYINLRSRNISRRIISNGTLEDLNQTDLNPVTKTDNMITKSSDISYPQIRRSRSMKRHPVYEQITNRANANVQNRSMTTTEQISPANYVLQQHVIVSTDSLDESYTTNYQDFPKDLNDTSDPNSTTNSSTQQLEHAPVFKTQTLVKGVVLLGLGAIAFSGNVATLVSIIRRGRQHSSTVYLLLVHLSVADLLVTWFCIIGEGLWTLTVEWHGGNAMCKLFKMMQVLALYLSTYILVVIGFDRLCAVRFPMRRIKARTQVHKAVIISWVLSVVLSVPQAFIFRVAKGPFIEEFHQCVTYGFYTAAWQEQLYTSIILFCQFLIPLCIIIGTYATTFATIANSGKSGVLYSVYSFKAHSRRHRVFGGCPFENARSKVLRKAKIKSLWITVVIVSTFIVCWTPYYVSMVVSVFLEAEEELGDGPAKDLRDAIFFFGSSTAVLNPLIYGAFHLRRRAERPSSSSRSSSKFEPSLALSTLRKVRVTSGREVRRTTHQEFF